MVQRIPPPPPLAIKDPALNRWLLELTAILNASGGIDPGQIAGFAALQAQVATNTTDIGTLQADVTGNTGDIGTLQGEVNTLLVTTIPAINGQLTTLGARNQVFNGVVAPTALQTDGDWYADTAGKHIYVQVAGAWVLVL